PLPTQGRYYTFFGGCNKLPRLLNRLNMDFIMQPTTFTQSLLDRYIDEEKALQERQQSLAALTVHLDANDLAMLNTISKRFNKNRAEVAEELLANALIDIFTRFESGERK